MKTPTISTMMTVRFKPTSMSTRCHPRPPRVLLSGVMAGVGPRTVGPPSLKQAAPRERLDTERDRPEWGHGCCRMLFNRDPTPECIERTRPVLAHPLGDALRATQDADTPLPPRLSRSSTLLQLPFLG
jgi:hypothetical protein